MHKLVTFSITPLHICELFGTKVMHTLDRKFTFCQTAQFYLKYCLFFKVLSYVFMPHSSVIHLEKSSQKIICYQFLGWMYRRKKKAKGPAVWVMGFPFVTKVSSSRGLSLSPLEQPQVENMLQMRAKNKCLLWMFHWNILNIEEVEDWNCSQNSVFSQQI